MSSSSSETDQDTMNMLPGIVPVSSLASFSDSTVSSSSGRASPSPANVWVSANSPPRSIFGNYWASPRCSSSGEGSGGSQAPTATLEKVRRSGGDKERELLYKLSSLSLPLVDDREEERDDDEDDAPRDVHDRVAQQEPAVLVQ